MTADEGKSVLSRWSRRKLEARREREAAIGPPAAGAPAAGPPAADAPLDTPPVDVDPAPAPPPLTDADMPDIDSLDTDSDFSPFMSPGVSDELRNLALRKLFRAPVFNIRDGLDEYDDDFTSFEKLGNIVTADMKHRIEMEEQKLREKLAREAGLDDEAGAGRVAEEDVEAAAAENVDDAASETDETGAGEKIELSAQAVDGRKSGDG